MRIAWPLFFFLILMLYYFSIAGISLCWDLPFSVRVSAESEPFLLDSPPGTVDLTVTFQSVDSLPQPPADAVWESGYSFSGDSVFYCDHESSPCYARLRMDMNAGKIYLDYLPNFECRFANTQSVWNSLGLEKLLLSQSTLLLHCSFIRFHDRGILFSAPSGTGKSTQAELWRRFRGAEIINGDRAALRRSACAWDAWGLPYAGTSGIYRNESAPIRAIVVLRQAKTNTIRSLMPFEAVRYLYPELTLHRWETESVDLAMNLLTDLVLSVPVFLLECRPDEDAVLLLEHTLKEVP